MSVDLQRKGRYLVARKEIIENIVHNENQLDEIKERLEKKGLGKELKRIRATGANFIALNRDS